MAAAWRSVDVPVRTTAGASQPTGVISKFADCLENRFTASFALSKPPSERIQLIG